MTCKEGTELHTLSAPIKVNHLLVSTLPRSMPDCVQALNHHKFAWLNHKSTHVWLFSLYCILVSFKIMKHSLSDSVITRYHTWVPVRIQKSFEGHYQVIGFWKLNSTVVNAASRQEWRAPLRWYAHCSKRSLSISQHKRFWGSDCISLSLMHHWVFLYLIEETRIGIRSLTKTYTSKF